MATSMKAISLWVNKHGTGVFKFFDGSKYSGAWFDGKYHGYGVYESKSKARYDGMWYEGQYEGEG